MKKIITLVAAIGLIASSAIVSADKNKDDNPEIETLKMAGSFLTSRMDANADGLASSWCTIMIKGGNQGSSMMQCINEDVFAGVTPECPGGLFVVDQTYGGTGVGTRTFPSAEDQIFVQLTERNLCANQLNQVTSGIDRGVILGGTGRYSGATGTYEWNYTGQIMYADLAAQPAQFYGSLLGTGTWVINFPE